MSFSLHSGLYIFNPGIAVVLLLLWIYLVRKQFELALSLIIIGSYAIQYTEINLIAWRGSLLMPVIGIFIPRLMVGLVRTVKLRDDFEKVVFFIITIFFSYSVIRGLINTNNYYIYAMSLLQNIARIYAPFFGIYLISLHLESIYKHVRYNAYFGLSICIGFLLIIFISPFSIGDTSKLRFITFWKMPIAGFSSIALWCFFYYFAIFLYSGFQKLLSFAPLLISAAIILLGQSRGLILSLATGIFSMMIIAQKKIKWVGLSLIVVVTLVYLGNSLTIDIAGQTRTYSGIYLDRLLQLLIPGALYEESRYYMWQEAWASIKQHPFGGAKISSKVGVHNAYLQMLMQFGIFGGLYLIIIFILLINGVVFLKRHTGLVRSPEFNIITFYTMGIFSHAIIGGILGGVDTYFYWSIAMIVVLRKIIRQSLSNSIAQPRPAILVS